MRFGAPGAFMVTPAVPRAKRPTVLVRPGSFEAERHYYPKVLNAHLHPVVRHFLSLGNARIAERYCHLHPTVDPEIVSELLTQKPRWFRWGGADLFPVTTEHGKRRIVVIETNSCPSGQKSMPFEDELGEQAGYRRLIERSFLPMSRQRGLPKGALAVIYDKNEMEASGYAATIADVCNEDVLLATFDPDDPDPSVRVSPTGVIEVVHEGSWQPIRCAFRYVTQRPWTRIPPVTRTAVFNPIVACLAGGRNKLVAAKAYDLFNAELRRRTPGLCIRTPSTQLDVGLDMVPLWVRQMGGLAVIKNPYSNAGQGVWTVTNEEELSAFMALDHRYDRFIVQALIGNYNWSSTSEEGRLYHLGTVPDRHRNIFVADLRFMVAADHTGFYPVAIYARRARRPLTGTLSDTSASWDMLGTNLSVRTATGWKSETERLLLMDSRDFNRLGLGLDDLIEGYMQAVLSMQAIDNMATSLVTKRGKFRRRLFGQVNPDPSLLQEIISL